MLGVLGHKQNESQNLVQHHPVGVDLCVSLRIQNHSLVLSEVSEGDLSIFWTYVDGVNDGVVVKILLAYVTHAVA